MRRMGLFLFAGAIGFAVDMAVLWMILRFELLDPFSARVVAIATAMVCTYLINRTFTFGASHRKVSVEGTRYGGVGVASALISYAIYSACLIVLPKTSPYLALVVGSGSATVFSYLGYSRFVFGPRP